MSEYKKVDSEIQFLNIHYYLNDDSHSMNAFIRNNMEKDFLGFITEISKTLNVEIHIETQAYKEGGLVEILVIATPIACYFKESINHIIIHYITGQNKKQKLENKKLELEIELLREKLKQEKSNTEIKELEKQLLQSYEEINNNHKIQRALSNFYQKAKNYEKIKQIGYKIEKNKEEIVERDRFSEFILVNKNDIEILENVSIEIISPVLKEGKYKWKGIYENEKIDFSMGDSRFKQDVIGQKYNFSNGSVIICSLEIKNTFDDFGEKSKNTTYRVKKVYEIKTNDIVRKTKAGHKKDREDSEDKQLKLFDNLD